MSISGEKRFGQLSIALRAADGGRSGHLRGPMILTLSDDG
jgi:hypothetical protein